MSVLEEMDQAAAAVRLPHLERLKELGVPYAKLAELNAEQHTVGVARVTDAGGGLFGYAAEGFGACLVAAVDRWRMPDEAGVFDIIAFSPGKPERWWGRRGLAFALGDHLLDLDEPVHVVATPVQWLACGGDALVILDWSLRSPVWSALRRGPSLQFDNDELRFKVRNMLVQAAPMPPMETLCA